MSVPQRGFIGLGTTLEYKYAATFVPLARITEIGEIPLSGEADDVEVTGYDTPTRVREYIAGMEDPGDIDITGVWTADVSQAGVMDSRDVNDWRITLPNNLGAYIIPGFAHGFKLNPQLDDRIEFSFTLRVAGQVTAA